MATIKRAKLGPGLTLTQAIFPTVLLLRIYGLDIAPPANPSLLRRFILKFLNTCIVSTCLITLPFAIGAFSVERDIANLLLNVIGILTILELVFTQIYFRVRLNDLVNFVDKAQRCLRKLEGAEKSFLFWLQIISYIIVSVSVTAIVDAYWEYYSIYISTEEGKVVSKLLTNEGQIDGLRTFFLLVAVPLFNVWYGMVYVVLATAMMVLIFIFKHLSDVTHPLPTAIKCPKPYLNDMVNFIHVHREACALMRKYDRIFRNLLLFMLMISICDVLAFLRVAFGKNQSPVHFGMALAVVTVLMAEVCLAGMLNNLVLTSLKRLSHLRLAVDENKRLSPNMAWALTAKVELYYDHVLLDQPALTAGGLVKMTKGDIIAIFGFLMTYTLFLFEKNEI